MKKTKKSKINETRQDKIFNVINMTILWIVLILVAYPLIYVLSASFSNPQAVSSGKVWLWPVDFTLRGYEVVFQHPDIVRGFLNAIYITVLGTVVQVIITIMAAYPLSRKTLYGKGVITLFFTFTMFFGGGLIPTFILINNLGLYNTYWALILPGAVGVYNVIVARTFFQTTIPEDLFEAGQLDGCSDFRFLISVVLPLSKPIIAVLVMFYAVGHWNSYFGPMIYLADKQLYPLQIVLRNILVQNQFDSQMMMDVASMEQQKGLAELIKYSVIVVSSLPMLILYPFIQKHFVKGVMIGAIKG
ncbi:MAG: carbohydrate ABC transporter permease [Clostridiales bacterium]|jgi:putative aldouronate transport system permease protein|nr:carbohydrate ABC transporter permease [Clostridiales bacterium]MDU6975905.1 carbohydrate ABC transporter permease [Clostridiales bacterium]